MESDSAVTLHSLGELNDDWIEQLARLHHAVMPTLLSDLGLPFVRRYYQAAAADPTVIGFVACDETGRVVGFAMGCPDPGKLNDQIRRPLSWFVRNLIQAVARRPGLLRQLWISAGSAAAAMRNEPEAVEWIYLGLASGLRGRGLGRMLMQRFLQGARQAGYKKAFLTVETNNTNAIGLYESEGFRVVRTFKEGRFDRHRMVILL